EGTAALRVRDVVAALRLWAGDRPGLWRGSRGRAISGPVALGVNREGGTNEQQRRRERDQRRQADVTPTRRTDGGGRTMEALGVGKRHGHGTWREIGNENRTPG